MRRPRVVATERTAKETATRPSSGRMTRRGPTRSANRPTKGRGQRTGSEKTVKKSPLGERPLACVHIATKLVTPPYPKLQRKRLSDTARTGHSMKCLVKNGIEAARAGRSDSGRRHA